MKRTLLTITSVLLLLVACKSNTQKIQFSEGSLHYDSWKSNIDLKYPIAVSKNGDAAQNINRAIVDCLVSQEVTTLEGYITEAKKYESDSIPYQTASEWSGYSNDELTSIQINHYLFTGGAHGNTTISTLTFDNKTGTAVDLHKHITDTIAFQKILATEYAAQNSLKIDTPADSIGYFTPLTELPIPTTMFLTDNGLRIMYSQYEIACYAVGITSVTIPYEKIEGVFNLLPKDLKAIVIEPQK